MSSTTMEVWNEEIKDEKERNVTIKDLVFRIKEYTTEKQDGGIRIPIEDNNELCDKFFQYCKELDRAGKLSEREKKFNLIRFSTFADSDKSGIQMFPLIGFYCLKDHIIFAVEEDSPAPLKRLTMWVDYYKKYFNIQTKPKEDLFDVLSRLDLTDGEEEF